jgi:hypothetical protein
MELKDLTTYPAVYAVGDEYQIISVFSCEALVWAEVGGEQFFDESNGIIRSAKPVHKVSVPMELLNEKKEYKICYRRVIERKPYYTETEDIESLSFAFRPVENETIKIYHIADAHNKVATPVAAGQFFGDELDLLVLNGDIPNHSGDIKNFDAIHEIAGRITKGAIPVIFSRGNHDMRGIYAESIAEYTPTDRGNSYFTFRLGDLWGLVLDCGEDKPDSSIEYGNTICCHAFRRRETRFIEKVIKNAKNEYLADGVKKRIVICHDPFTYTPPAPFDIEIELFTYWARLLGEHIKPDFMLCGHKHVTEVCYPGGERDNKGQPCPVIIGANPHKHQEPDVYEGCALIYGNESVTVRFTDQDGRVIGEDKFDIQ